MNKPEKIVQIFKQFADNISARYALEVDAATILEGKRPEFDDLLQQLRSLEHDLTHKGIELLNQLQLKIETTVEDTREKFQQIIQVTVEQFVSKL